jgi:hypothetical protein
MERDMEEIEAKVEKYSELLPELMDRLERELATEAYSLWTGFEGFCAESVGVEAKKVLQVVLSPNPALERVAGLEALARRLELEPDPEIAHALHDGLAEKWEFVAKKGV